MSGMTDYTPADFDDAIERLKEVGDGGVEFARLYERHTRALLLAMESMANEIIRAQMALMARNMGR